MADLSSFSSNDFSTSQWINAQLKEIPHGETLEGYLSSLSMKLHLAAQDYSDQLETAMVESMSTMPRLVAEIGRLEDQLKVVHGEMKNLSDQINMVDKKSISGVEDLSRLDALKSNMERCKSTLEEHARWSQLVREARQLLESGGTLSETADRVEIMFKSLDVLKELPGHEERLDTCTSYRSSLLSALAPNIRKEFTELGMERLQEYLYVFKKLNREDQFIEEYLQSRPTVLEEIWTSYSVKDNAYESFAQWLAHYLGSVSKFIKEEEGVIVELFGPDRRSDMVYKVLMTTLQGLKKDLPGRLQAQDSVVVSEECGVVLEEFCKRIFPTLLAEDVKLILMDQVIDTIFTGYSQFQPLLLELEEKDLKAAVQRAMNSITFQTDQHQALFESSSAKRSASMEYLEIDLYDPVELLNGFIEGIIPSLAIFFEVIERTLQRSAKYLGGIALKAYTKVIISSIQLLHKHLCQKLEILGVAVGAQDTGNITADQSYYSTYTEEMKLAGKIGNKLQSIDIDKQSVAMIVLKSIQAVGRFKVLIQALEGSMKNISSEVLSTLYQDSSANTETLVHMSTIFYALKQLKDENLYAELKSFLAGHLQGSNSSGFSVLHSAANRLASISNNVLLLICVSPIIRLLDGYQFIDSEGKVTDDGNEEIEGLIENLLPQPTVTQIGEILLAWVQDLETFAASDALDDLLSLRGEAYPLSCTSAGWKAISTKLDLKDERSITQLASRYIVIRTMQAYERELAHSGRANHSHHFETADFDQSVDDGGSLSGQTIVFVNEWLAVIADSIVGLFISQLLLLDSSKARSSVTAARAQLFSDVDYLCNVINATGIRCHPLLLHLKHMVREKPNLLAKTLNSLLSGKNLGSLKDVLNLDLALFRSVCGKDITEQ